MGHKGIQGLVVTIHGTSRWTQVPALLAVLGGLQVEWRFNRVFIGAIKGAPGKLVPWQRQSEMMNKNSGIPILEAL